MKQATSTIGKYPVSNMVHDCPPPVSFSQNQDKEFFEDLRVILNATNAKSTTKSNNGANDIF